MTKTQIETMKENSVKIYENNQVVKMQCEKMGMPVPAVCNLSANELYQKMYDDEIAAEEKREANSKKRAGYKALCKKYGEESAKRIITRAKGQ